VQRVVSVGPGAAGKSTLAVSLGEVTDLPVVELDKLFRRAGLAGYRLSWSAWRRRHQRTAQACHYRRQAARDP
jgi:adenylate kinase family enzyme